MSITLETATVGSLDEVVEAVASWQQDGGSVQLHPGDLGWNSSFGADALARSLRVWRRDGLILAAGMVEDGLIRMALAPTVDRDESFAAQFAGRSVGSGARGAARRQRERRGPVRRCLP